MLSVLDRKKTPTPAEELTDMKIVELALQALHSSGYRQLQNLQIDERQVPFVVNP